MRETKDAIEVLRWAAAYGDPKIVDRIMVKVLPELQANGIQLTGAQIEHGEHLELPAELVDRMREAAEELIAADHPDATCHV